MTIKKFALTQVSRIRLISAWKSAQQDKIRRDALLRSGLFDAESYLTANPDVAQAGLDPLDHYLRWGHREGRWPSNGFDPAAYLAANPDVAQAGYEPLTHYAQHGQAEGRALQHDYKAELASMNEVPEDLRWAMLTSGLFDAEDYLIANPDVAEAGLDPLEHYVKVGYREGRRPSEAFDPAAYLAANPDVAQAGHEPLTHYLQRGRAEGRGTASDLPAYAISRRRIATERVAGRKYFRRHGLSFGKALPSPEQVTDAVTDLIGRSPVLRIEDIKPDVSIIIPVYGQLAFVLNCLDSLAGHTSRFSAEIVVMDDVSPENTKVEQLQAVPWIRYKRRSENGGFISTCNDAASIARGRYLVFLNSDTRVADGWLDELIGSFTLFPKAGLVGSKLLNEDGSLQEAGGIYWRDGSAWNYGRDQDPDHPKYSFARRVDYCSGAAIAVTQEAWTRVGGFDTAYAPAYCEDADIAFQLRKAGYEVWFQPLSCVLHYEGRSHGRDLNAGIKAYQVSNMKKLAARWKDVLALHAPNAHEPDREANRLVQERVLVLDAVTPTPDQDSGSFITIRMLKALRELGHQVTFVPHHNYLHYGRYTEALQRQGIECIYAPYVRYFGEILDVCGSFDYVLAYRHNVLHGIYGEVRRRLPHARVIFHNVDLHYLREEREAKLMGSRRGRILAAGTKAVELELISQADCNIVHTAVEADIIRQQVPVRNLVEFPYVSELHRTQVPFDARHNIMFLGGFNHTPNVDAMQFFVQSVWPLLLQRLPESSRLMIVGASPPPAVQQMANDRIVVTGYVEELKGYFDAARVFVAPLRYGAGIKGKVVQSLSYGAPAVVTPIAAEGIGLTSGHQVLIAEESEDFAERIMQIYTDRELWHHLQQAGYDFVDRNFSWQRCLELCNHVLDMADDTWIARHDRAVQRRLLPLCSLEDGR